jgi:hypothetical protein
MFSNRLDKILVKKPLSIKEFRLYAHENVYEDFLNSSYLCYGPFGSFVRDLILKGDQHEFVNRCFEYINELCEQGNPDINEMLRVTFFEPLTDSREVIELSKRSLSGNALSIFNKILDSPFMGRSSNK